MPPEWLVPVLIPEEAARRLVARQLPPTPRDGDGHSGSAGLVDDRPPHDLVAKELFELGPRLIPSELSLDDEADRFSLQPNSPHR
jgi:hypothetical protein